jgi:hypothetical protein
MPIAAGTVLESPFVHEVQLPHATGLVFSAILLLLQTAKRTRPFRRYCGLRVLMQRQSISSHIRINNVLGCNVSRYTIAKKQVA